MLREAARSKALAVQLQEREAQLAQMVNQQRRGGQQAEAEGAARALSSPPQSQ